MLRTSVRKTLGYKDLESKLRNKNFEAVYFLHGKEDFLIEELTSLVVKNAFENSFDAEMNFTLLYGQDTTLAEILNVAGSYPMMSDRRLVVVRNFEKVKKERSKDKAKSLYQSWQAYLKNPLDSTILFLVAGELDKKDLKEEPYLSLEPYASQIDYLRDTAGFITERAAKFGWQLTPEAVRQMTVYVGESIREISMELEKLFVYAAGRADKTITDKDVMTVVAVSREYDVFQLQKALVDKNLRMAAGITQMMLEEGTEPVMLTGQLTQYFMKLWKLKSPVVRRLPELEMGREVGFYSAGQLYFLKDLVAQSDRFTVVEIERALQTLLQADLEIKGVGSLGDAKLVFAMLIEKILRP
jgi:DNA polymerase-3 subunit delta